MTRMTGPDCAVMCNLISIHTWEDQREWHRMTRMTRPDCAVMCNLINTHTHTHVNGPPYRNLNMLLLLLLLLLLSSHMLFA